MLPVIMAAISLAQQKAQQQQANQQAFNQMNTQNLLANNQQQMQLPKMQSVFGSY